MSTFQISYGQKNGHLLRFNTEFSHISLPFLKRGSDLFKSFLDTERRINDLMQNSLINFESHPNNHTHIAALKSIHNIPLSIDQIEIIFRIWDFLRRELKLPPDESFRFKIQSLCSITLVTTPHSIERDTLYIHLKKKGFQTFLGDGLQSKVTRAIQFNENGFSLVAEKTLYRKEISRFDPNEHGLGPENRFFIKKPKALYQYTSNKTSEFGKKESVKKTCLIDDLYDMSLSEFLQIDQNTPFLSITSRWNILFFLAHMLKALHDQNLVYRDLKADNILIKLSEDLSSIDFNAYSLFAGDLETVIQEEYIKDSWVGTSRYWPKNFSKERQGKPSDVFVFGYFLPLLMQCKEFSTYPESIQKQLLELTKTTRDEDSSKRCSIEVVLECLNSCHLSVFSQAFDDLTLGKTNAESSDKATETSKMSLKTLVTLV